MSFYAEMQGVASELLGEFRQGTIIYRQPGEVSGPEFDPVIGPPVDHPLDAVAKGVSQRYVDGTSILATDKEVTAAVFGVTPDTSGTIVMDGKLLEIVRVWQVPGAGTVAAWKMVVRA